MCSTEIMQALAFALRWCDAHPAWISVEDELPHGGVYLFCNSNGAVFIATDEIGSLYKNVTHWMPLPAPPMEISGNQRKISPNHQQAIGTTDHIKIALDVIYKKGGEQ